VHGYLSLKLSGPRYELKFHHPELGLVELKGEKSYDITNLKESLTVCPLTVYQQGEAIGYAEVAYRDSMLAVPLQAIRLVRAEPSVGFQYGHDDDGCVCTTAARTEPVPFYPP